MQKTLILRGIWIVFALLVCASYGYQGQARAAAITSPVVQKDPKQCGTIALAPGGKLLDAKGAPQKGACFREAYEHCQMAMLAFSQSGVDTIFMQTFLIRKKEGRCQVADLVQQRVIPGPFRTQGFYTCVGISRAKHVLLIRECGSEGTVTIPLVSKR